MFLQHSEKATMIVCILLIEVLHQHATALTVTSTISQHEIAEMSFGVISLTFEPTDPPVSGYWTVTDLSGNEKILVIDGINFVDNGPNTLYIAEFLPSFTGIYIFHADNGIEKADGPPITVVLQGAPQVSTSMKNEIISLGQSFTIECSCLSSEPITEVKWLKNDTLGNSNYIDQSNTVKYSGGTPSNMPLTINNIDTNDAGDYWCQANNAKGSGTSTKITLGFATASQNGGITTMPTTTPYAPITGDSTTIIPTSMPSTDIANETNVEHSSTISSSDSTVISVSDSSTATQTNINRTFTESDYMTVAGSDMNVTVNSSVITATGSTPSSAVSTITATYSNMLVTTVSDSGGNTTESTTTADTTTVGDTSTIIQTSTTSTEVNVVHSSAIVSSNWTTISVSATSTATPTNVDSTSHQTENMTVTGNGMQITVNSSVITTTGSIPSSAVSSYTATYPNMMVTPEGYCPCDCAYKAKLDYWATQNITNYTMEEMRIILKPVLIKLENELRVNKNNLSATIRKLTSATDSRPSAKQIGSFGIVFIVLIILSIIISDLTSIRQHVSLLKIIWNVNTDKKK